MSLQEYMSYNERQHKANKPELGDVIEYTVPEERDEGIVVAEGEAAQREMNEWASESEK